MISLNRVASNEETQRRFRDALHVASGLLKWVLPDSEETVRATGHVDEEMHVQLPEGLRDPLAILDGDPVNMH